MIKGSAMCFQGFCNVIMYSAMLSATGQYNQGFGNVIRNVRI